MTVHLNGPHDSFYDKILLLFSFSGFLFGLVFGFSFKFDFVLRGLQGQKAGVSGIQKHNMKSTKNQ